MNIKDLLIEEISFSGGVHVASVGETGAEFHWSGDLYPGMEHDLRAEDGSLPDWFAKKEVMGIAASDGKSLMIVVE